VFRRPPAAPRALQQDIEEGAQQRHLPVLALAEQMLDLAAQATHILVVERLRTGPENALDTLHCVSETCRQDCRRHRGMAIVATQLKFEQPAAGGIVNTDAVDFKGADLGHGGAQLYPHFALIAASERLYDRGDGRQANEIIVVEQGDFARPISIVGNRRREVKSYRL